MNRASHLLLRRLLLLAGPSALAACGGRADLETLSYQAAADDDVPEQGGAAGAGGGQGGAAGKAGSAGKGGSAGKAGAAGASVCNNDDPIPRTADGSLDCGPAPGGTFGICESRCYVPGPSTIPGPCRPFGDPALLKLPNFATQNCGFSGPSLGPFCNEEAEKFAGNSPACCYLGQSQPCAGRPLLLGNRLSVAPLQQTFWA